MNVLIIGGTGFVSGAMARAALQAGHRVWTITRGRAPVSRDILSLIADRTDPAAFRRTVEQADTYWDLVIDCIGYEPEDARQDVELFADRAGHLVFISTDFTFDPWRRRFPQPFDNPYYLTEGYGGKKRQCELEFIGADCTTMRWTVFRPCHIYGPGSQLGCLPHEARKPDLIERIRAGESLQLVGGGHFLQQPIFVDDLAQLVLSASGSDLADEKIYCSAGPDIIESRRYYEIIAEVLGVRVSIEEAPVDAALAAQPELAPFLCHRVYDLSPLNLDGLKVPNTPIADGLAAHVESLLA